MNNSKFIDSRSNIKYRSSIKKFVFLSVVCFLAAVLASCGLIADNFRDAGTDSNGFSVNVRSAGDSVAGSRVAMTTTTTWDSEAAFNAAVSQYRVKVGDEPWQVVSPGGTVTSAVRYAPGASVVISYIANANVKYTGNDGGNNNAVNYRLMTISEETKTISVGQTTTRVNFRIRDTVKANPEPSYTGVKLELLDAANNQTVVATIYPKENENISDSIEGYLGNMRASYSAQWMRGKTYLAPAQDGQISLADLVDGKYITISFAIRWDANKYILLDVTASNPREDNYKLGTEPMAAYFSVSSDGKTFSEFTQTSITIDKLKIRETFTVNGQTAKLTGFVLPNDMPQNIGDFDVNQHSNAITDMKLNNFYAAGENAITWVYQLQN